ncbi:Multidrug resistance protein MdtC [Planctomycetes bacterium Pan216]|uniref:Multidrug resistance protein MdtC n=2 Tax=Kolteria novifilia TaxID=2527975 RepID=A0A518B8P4_9BACT|nr:Multidrug resistance protein MdtC [Planctomycetes bacterium Pan216]
MVLVSAVALTGYLPETVSKPTKARVGDREIQRPTQSERVTNSFDLSRSEAFLVVDGDDLFNPATMAAIRSMVDAVEGMEIVDTVFWVDRIPMLNVFGIADPLIPPNGSSPEAFLEAREELLEHPLIVGQLLSPDGRTLMMPIVYDWFFVDDDASCTEGVLETARQALEASASKSGLVDIPRVQITGNVPLYLATRTAFKRNQWFYRIAGYGMILLLSIVLFRGLTAVLVVASGPAIGIFWAFGLIELSGVYINELANVVLPVLLSLVGLADSVHLVVHVRQRRALGDTPLEAAASAIRDVGPACLLTSLTTAIGFLSLLTASSEFVQDFGRVCAMGVGISFTAVVTLVPLLTSFQWIGGTIERGQERDLIGWALRRCGSAIDWILRHHRFVSTMAILSTIGLLLVSSTLRPDNRLEDAMPASTNAYKALAYCDEAFGGIEFARIEVTWPKSLQEDDGEILQAIIDVEELVGTEPLVQHPLSIRGLLAFFPGDKDDHDTQMTFLSLLPKRLKGFFLRDKDRTAWVVVRVQDRGTAAYEPVFQRIEQGLADLGTRHPGFTFDLDGGPVRRTRELYLIVVDLTASLGTATLIILAVMAVVYRSLRIGLITIIPNIFPLAATGALLVLLGQPLTMASVCAFTVCLGIAVDDTIHFMTRFQRELREGHHWEEAIRRTFLTVGTALVMTTIILVAGFSIVLMSDMPGHQTFGSMASATISSALLGDLLFLPAMLATFLGRGHSKKENDGDTSNDREAESLS